MQASPFKQRISYGGVNFSIIMGLASQDTCENALAELGLDNIRLLTPVVHGDTLYAYSEVLEVRDADRDDAGEVTFRHYGVNQRDQQIFQGDRRVLLKRRSHWGDK
jgi:acyl dehydratase